MLGEGDVSMPSCLHSRPLLLVTVLMCSSVVPVQAADVNCRQKPVADLSDYSIELIPYKEKSMADGLVSRLAQKSFVAQVDGISAAERPYMVRMTGFASEDDAEACRALLIDRTTISDSNIEVIKAQSAVAVADSPKTLPLPAEKVVADAVNADALSVLGRPPVVVAKGMSLQQVIAYGLGHNVTYRQQVSRLPILDLDAQAALDPFSLKTQIASSSNQRVGSELGQTYQVSFNKKFSAGTNAGIGLGTSRFAGQSLSEMSFSISQPLLKGRGSLVNNIGIDMANQNRFKQRNMVRYQKQQLILDMISTYYRAVLQKQSIRIHQTTIEQSQEMLDSSNAKFKFGMVSRMDVFRAELQLLEAQESLESAQGAHERALDELQLLIGAKSKAGFALSDPILAEQASIADAESLIERALSSRHELANLKLDQEMLGKQTQVARNNLLPQLDVTFQVSQTGTDSTFSKSTRLRDTRFGVGLSGSPDFGLAAEQAQYKRQLLAHEHARMEYQQTEEKIRSDVKNSLRQIRQGKKRIALRKSRVEASEKQKQYALVRYQKGLVDNAAVVEAEKAMVTSKIGHLQAIVDYNLSVYALYHETNQLSDHWMQKQ